MAFPRARRRPPKRPGFASGRGARGPRVVRAAEKEATRAPGVPAGAGDGVGRPRAQPSSLHIEGLGDGPQIEGVVRGSGALPFLAMEAACGVSPAKTGDGELRGHPASRPASRVCPSGGTSTGSGNLETPRASRVSRAIETVFEPPGRVPVTRLHATGHCALPGPPPRASQLSPGGQSFKTVPSAPWLLSLINVGSVILEATEQKAHD